MKKSEEGFSTPVALAVISSLYIITISVVILVHSTERKIGSYQRRVHAKAYALALLNNVSEEMQLLSKYENGLSDDVIVNGILSKFSQNNLQLADVSTGINKKFLKKSILENNAIAEYLLQSDSVETNYGWVNPKYADEDLIKSIQNDFNSGNTFPLINQLPFYNVFEMSNEFLLAVLKFNNIENPEEKTQDIQNALQENLSIEKIREILSVPANHPVFDFIGTKTIFWKATFETDECKVCAVYGAVPDENNQSKIQKYILVEQHIEFKGGEPENG